MNDNSAPVKPAGIARLTERAALYQEAASERLDLNATDLRCLTLAAAEPGMTASRLAELSGLSSGAITGVLDRLERARFARREADPADRRRILVRPLPDRVAEITAAYAPLEEAMARVLDRYESGGRAAIGDFMEQAIAVLEDQATRLRAHSRGGIVGEMFTAALGTATVGRLVFRSGAPRLAVRAAPLGPEAEARIVAELAHTSLVLRDADVGDALAHGTFTGPMPDVRTRGGVVAVRYRRRIDWRRRGAEIGLSPAVAWDVEISGGLSSLAADIRVVRLRSVVIRGGINTVDVRLPEADGTSRFSLAGGAADVTLRHPAGSAVRLAVSGGINDATFGAERLRQVHGELRLETPDSAAAARRWEIEISGGVRTLVVIGG